MDAGEESKRLTRALILNALVLPGSGHVLIGAKVQGVLLGTATIVFLLAPIIRFITAFQTALQNHPHPSLSGSLGIVAAVGQAWKAHAGFILICLLAVILVWAYGVWDIAMKIKRGKNEV